jgi:hypothetical protein
MKRGGRLGWISVLAHHTGYEVFAPVSRRAQ